MDWWHKTPRDWSEGAAKNEPAETKENENGDKKTSKKKNEPREPVLYVP